MATYKIHPGIGIARLGNSDTEFYIAPETPAGLPQVATPTATRATGPTGLRRIVTTLHDEDASPAGGGFRCSSTTTSRLRVVR